MARFYEQCRENLSTADITGDSSIRSEVEMLSTATGITVRKFNGVSNGKSIA